MLNKVILMGRLTADIELRHTSGGVATASFSIAVDRNYEDNEGKRKADFINIVAWRQTALFIEKYFKKGSLVALEGSIQTRNYEDKQGNKRTAFEIVAEQVYFAGSKPKDKSTAPELSEESDRAGEGAPSGFNPDDFEEVEGEDANLPF